MDHRLDSSGFLMSPAGCKGLRTKTFIIEAKLVLSSALRLDGQQSR